LVLFVPKIGSAKLKIYWIFKIEKAFKHKNAFFLKNLEKNDNQNQIFTISSKSSNC